MECCLGEQDVLGCGPCVSLVRHWLSVSVAAVWLLQTHGECTLLFVVAKTHGRCWPFHREVASSQCWASKIQIQLPWVSPFWAGSSVSEGSCCAVFPDISQACPLACWFRGKATWVSPCEVPAESPSDCAVGKNRGAWRCGKGSFPSVTVAGCRTVLLWSVNHPVPGVS